MYPNEQQTSSRLYLYPSTRPFEISLHHIIFSSFMTSVVYLDITVGDHPIGRMEFELYSDVVPLAAENFRCLCTGMYTAS